MEMPDHHAWTVTLLEPGGKVFLWAPAEGYVALHGAYVDKNKFWTLTAQMHSLVMKLRGGTAIHMKNDQERIIEVHLHAIGTITLELTPQIAASFENAVSHFHAADAAGFEPNFQPDPVQHKLPPMRQMRTCLRVLFNQQPYVFRYVGHPPHSATGPLKVAVPGEEGCITCLMWLSHGGLVVSLQPQG